MERREGMGEVIDRLSKIESRLSRIEGGLILAAFVTGAIVAPLVMHILEVGHL